MKKSILTLAIALTASVTAFATQYCQTAIKSVDGTATINLTCEKIADGNYRLVVEGTNLNGFGGSFYNPGAVDIRSTMVTNTPTKLECAISAESDPQLYTPLYVMMPGEVVFNWPSDVEWGRCSSGVEDKEAPVLNAASLVSNTHNSAIIAVSATDNIGVIYYEVSNGTTVLGNVTAIDGQITVKNLAPNTTYTLTIKAVDAAGNKSAAKTVTVTTDSFAYCDAPTGHLGDANFGDPNGRILLTISQVNDNTINVLVKPNYANGATQQLDFLYVDPKFGVPFTVGGDVPTGGEDEMNVNVTFDESIPATFTLNIQWSNPGWDGRWSADFNGISINELCGAKTGLHFNKNTTKAKKVIENGQMIIISNGVRLNIFGQPINQ